MTSWKTIYKWTQRYTSFHSTVTEKQTNKPFFFFKKEHKWLLLEKRHTTVVVEQCFVITPHKRQQIAIVAIFTSHKKYQHCARDNKNLFVEMKRRKGRRETGMRQQSATDSTLNTGPWLDSWWSQHRYGGVCKAMLAKLLTCFSRSFGYS